MSKRFRYCIIGAGAAGLAALKTLRDLGIAAECFEKAAKPGGHWHHDYDALHLITPKNSSFFDDFPMPADYPLYPSRQQVCDYIQSYVDAFQLHEHIHYHSAIEQIVPQGEQGEGGWQVWVNGEARHFDGVLVANGHLWDPALPSQAADFQGISLHSAAYRNTRQIKGKVLVVGFGNSGCDLAVDAAQQRFDTTIVMRRGQVFQPKALFGMPRAELPFINELPAELQNSLMQVLIMASLGNWKNYPGMPQPDSFNLDEQPPVVNNLLLYWIQHGRIAIKPAITAIENKTVTFSDGSQQQYDTILWATGFHTRLPFLADELLEWQQGVPLRTAGMTLPTRLENLWFVGLAAPRGAQWPVYCAQTRLIARMIELKQQGMRNLAGLFARQQVAEARIDIVRRIWQQNMDETHRTLDMLTSLSRDDYQLVAAYSY